MNYSQTTISIRPDTKDKLKQTQKTTHYRTYDDLIQHLLTTHAQHCQYKEQTHPLDLITIERPKAHISDELIKNTLKILYQQTQEAKLNAQIEKEQGDTTNP